MLGTHLNLDGPCRYQVLHALVLGEERDSGAFQQRLRQRELSVVARNEHGDEVDPLRRFASGKGCDERHAALAALGYSLLILSFTLRTEHGVLLAHLAHTPWQFAIPYTTPPGSNARHQLTPRDYRGDNQTSRLLASAVVACLRAAAEREAVISLAVVIVFLVILAVVLALAEASISRMTLARAMALREQGRRNADRLEQIESDPARYLNSVYLCVMFAQNGSAILVAILAEHSLGDVGITVLSVVFTLTYFVVVEAMSKTFAVLHSDRVALFLAPFVWVLGRSLAIPTRALIGLGNALLPGKGLPQGPFVIQHEIRSLADIGHEDGGIAAHEKEMIHSVFEFGDLIVRNVMVPRPDIVALDLASPIDTAADLIVRSGFSRIPAYHGDLDHTEGIVHAKDVLHGLRQGRHGDVLAELLRPVHFVPDFKRLVELLHEMKEERFHLAMVTDEYGSLVGLVTREDLLEELVGRISDEQDHEAPEIMPLDNGRYRVNAALPILELNDTLGANLPHDRWNTVGGLVFGLAGAIPSEGAVVELDTFRFTVERVQGRRIVTVLVDPLAVPCTEPDEAG